MHRISPVAAVVVVPRALLFSEFGYIPRSGLPCASRDLRIGEREREGCGRVSLISSFTPFRRPFAGAVCLVILADDLTVR